MADHLVSRGGREFGFIAGPASSQASQDRLRGFRERLREAGTERVRVAEATYEYEGGHSAALALFEDCPAPDALFCANDLMAMGAIDALRRVRRLRVPDDVLVAGFDDIPAAAWSAYDLTTVAQQAHLMVERAIDLLGAAIAKHGESQNSLVTFPAELVTRGSTDRH